MFFQSFIDENPDLLKINNFTNPINYETFYVMNRLKQKRFEVEAFLAPMFTENITRCTQTIKEYEELTIKMRKISQVAQKIFLISLLTDKLEKEKYCDGFNNKVKELENKI